MTTEWRVIRFFPDYSVSSTGYVRNDDTGRRMTMLVNQAGVVNVGLTRNRVQYKRAVAPLVAKAFIDDRISEAFNCPINLNGDRFNNSVENLMWRPKWFATKYFRQFEEAHFEDYNPIEDVDTHEWFANPWEAAKRFGLLQVEIILSICNNTFVWPTRQKFQQTRRHADIMTLSNHGV
jgi:hypothetical protein